MEQTKRQWIRAGRWMAGTCGLLGMVFAAQAGWAQQVANHASPGTQSAAARPSASSLPSGAAAAVTRSAAEEAAFSEPRKHGGEGITVHGHWTIEAHNPDGTLASHIGHAALASSNRRGLRGRLGDRGVEWWCACDMQQYQHCKLRDCLILDRAVCLNSLCRRERMYAWSYAGLYTCCRICYASHRCWVSIAREPDRRGKWDDLRCSD
jgi:hypothetical protein